VADEKQHQALYRRYRPQNPQEILGQEHVVRALTGAIQENRLAHAFLFCGPRGTGKTSTARILAKMVNCERGPTAEPCGVCDQCVAIREGSHIDVFEIDAASHGGVEDARDLREKAPTAPAYGREKVYIIDEAQRLSREAFDALLKVFEEPPEGVRFVLATTEPHKMPATIVGRCQRFDFRRAGLDTLGDNLQRIAKEEDVALSTSAAASIARHAEGSFRDSLSLLDQAMVVAGGGEVDDAVVASLLGPPRSETQRELADAVSIGDTRTVFEIVHRLVQEGQDLRHVTNETLSHFRNLLLSRTAPGQEGLLDVTPDEAERLRAQAGKFTPAELSRVIALLLDAQADMRWTTSPRLSLELALVRATIPETDPGPQGLVERLERLERLAGVQPGAAGSLGFRSEPDAEVVSAPPAARSTSGGSPSSAPGSADKTVAASAVGGSGEVQTTETSDPRDSGSSSSPRGSKGRARDEAGTDEVTVVPDAAEAPVHSGLDTSNIDVEMLRRSWPGFVEHLQTKRQPILKALLETATPATYGDGTLELAFPPGQRPGVAKVEKRMPELRSALESFYGIEPAVRCVVREPVARANEPDPEIDDEPAPSEEEALRRIREQLGARPRDGGETS
jgi:DNA polymerase III subunit gamma/tau